jgi:succinoglycan biosynthesis protein ExoA
VSIVVPLLNEELHIARLARSLLDQDYPKDRYEILMADGGSTDGTLEILKGLDAQARVRILPNPGRTAPAALNVLIRASRGEIVTRVDGHSRVAPDYLSRIVQVMEETGEAVVGGPVLLETDTPFRRALVEALLSPLGVGAVPYRTLRTRSFVESLQTGSFRREVLLKVGPFDESLAVVEDLDMNTRIRAAGYRLLLDPSIRFWYYPRQNLRALSKQIFTVGRVKAWILRKHPTIFKLKYVLPSVFVLAALASLAGIAAAASGGARVAGFAGAWFLGAYVLAVLAFAVTRIEKLGAHAFRLVLILPTLHTGYGIGFLLGAIEAIGRRRVATPKP